MMIEVRSRGRGGKRVVQTGPMRVEEDGANFATIRARIDYTERGNKSAPKRHTTRQQATLYPLLISLAITNTNHNPQSD